MLRLIHTFCKYAYSLNQNTLFNITNNHLPLISCPSGRLLFNLRKNSLAQKVQAEDVFKTLKKQMGSMPNVHPGTSSQEIIIVDEDISISSEDEDYIMNDIEHHVKMNWEPVPGYTQPHTVLKSSIPFRVLSYNILAQDLLESHPHLYTKCHYKNLKWEARRKKIINDIFSSQADIVCLQEVQSAHYPEIAKYMIGFSSVYKKKMGKQDGCAIFYKKSKFVLKEQASVEFYQNCMPVLNRDNVALLLKLVAKSQPDSIPLVIVNTHLLFNRKRDDVRMAQLKLLLAELDRFAYYDHTNKRGYAPIVITGDFNSAPDSLLVKAITSGFVHDPILRDDASDWRRVSITDNCQHFSILMNRVPGYQASDFRLTRINHSNYPTNNLDGKIYPECSEFANLFNQGTVAHQFQLRSVYDIDREDFALATTFQQRWVTVDYIFFAQCTNLQLVDRLRLPTVEECSEMAPLPNHEHGSDHFAVGANFVLTLR